MDKFYDVLKQHIAAHQPNLGNGNSVLSLLYEAYTKCNRMDDDRIKANFSKLYHHMNSKDLREMYQILDPVCSLCRDYERVEFMAGVAMGIRMNIELSE